MAHRPPHDGTWDDVLEEVNNALDELNLADDDARQALLDGVREALTTLTTSITGQLDELSRPFPGAAFPGMEFVETPDVTVVEGGRNPGDPLPESEPPRLHIADETDAPTEEVPREQAPTGSRVRVVKLERRGAEGNEDGFDVLGEADDLLYEGRILVRGVDDWQTIFHGIEPVAYRIGCLEGVLQVALDGQPAERLLPGQSLDAEARILRVAAIDQAGARGAYVRLC